MTKQITWLIGLLWESLALDPKVTFGIQQDLRLILVDEGAYRPIELQSG